MRNWSQNCGNFGGSIEFSRQISLGVIELLFKITLLFHIITAVKHEMLGVDPSCDRNSMLTAMLSMRVGRSGQGYIDLVDRGT